MVKIKVAIDIENIWEEWGNFREVFRNMSLDTENFTLYIVTKSTNTELIDVITALLGLDSNTQVFHSITSDADVDTQLSSLGVEIYLSGDVELITLVNSNATSYAVLVNSIQDSYNMQPKWFTVMNFWIEKIDKANKASSGTTEEC